MMKPPIAKPFYYLPPELNHLVAGPARDRFCKVEQGKKKPAGQEDARGGAGVVSNEAPAVTSILERGR